MFPFRWWRDPISVSRLPHPLTCSFHREKYGHLTTWQWVSQREQSKSKHSKVLGRLCKVCMVKCIPKQIRACPLCCVYQSGLQSQLTPKGIGSRLDLVTRAATCCPGTAGTHGMFLWRPSTNHVTLSSFPLLSYCLYFITKISLLQVV